MPPKRTRISKEQKQNQSSTKQNQLQNISIRIGDVSKKKRRKAPRKRKVAEPVAPFRQLPPVVYQTLPQVSYYGMPSKTGSIVAKPDTPSSIVEPVKTKTTILEDIGMVGTEGPVEILDVPTKRETFATLITPIDIPRTIIDPVKQGEPFGVPPQVIDPVKSPSLPSGSSFDIPLQVSDPVESPPAILGSAKATSITEMKPKRKYAKTGKYSKKPEPQRPVSPLSFEGSFGVSPESVYTETERLFTSPKPQKSQPTMFRSDTPEPEFMQKKVLKFFEPRKRATTPKPSGLII